MTILGEMIMQDGVEKGRREGRKEGEDQINQLNTVLIKLNRLDDLKRATQDRAFQKKLIIELLPEAGRETL